MTTRTYKKTLKRKDNSLVSEDNDNLNLKRKTNDDSRVLKRSKKDKYPWFRINYKRPHTPLRSANTSLDEECYLSKGLEEEQSIQLIPYKKYLTFKSYSFLELWRSTENLLNHYDSQHRTLKPKNVTKTTENNKLGSLNSLDIENEKIKLACSEDNSVYTKRALSKMFGVNYQKLRNCLQKKEQNQQPIIGKKGRKTKILPQYLHFINTYLSDKKNCFSSIFNLKIQLQKEFSLPENTFSLNTVRKMIKLVGFHYKRCQRCSDQRNTNENKVLRFKLIEEIISHINIGRKFIYIDETGFNTFVSPVAGYARRSEVCIYEYKKRTKNFSVIAAMTDEEVLGYQIFQKGTTARDFGAFLINLIDSCSLKTKGLDNYVFFMDNSKTHHAKRLRKLRDYLHICFNAAYSPQLNPIEGLFSLWKFYYRPLKIINEEDVIKNINIAIKKITMSDIIGIVKHSIKYYFDCLENKDIN